MHNAWMRAVAGRPKSDYRYSKDIVYNNFIWPDFRNASQRLTCVAESAVSAAAQEILDIRQHYLAADVSCSLATLYDPLTMPPELVKAHAKLDALVTRRMAAPSPATPSASPTSSTSTPKP